MKKKQAFENLPVWLESLELVKEIYLLTSIFPEDEDDLLARKLYKQAVEIPINIAKAMQSEENRVQHLIDASLNIIELQTILVISEKLGFIEVEDVENIKDKSDKIDSSLQGLVYKLSKK